MYHVSMIEGRIYLMLEGSSLTRQTKDNYFFYSRDFFSWFFEKHPDSHPKEVDAFIVSEWLKTHPKWVSATKYQAVAALKKFYKWEYGEDHPVLQIKIKRTDPGPQRTLDKDELMDVMASIDTSTINGIRDLAILSLMVDTGLRATEVCDLELSRLDLKKQRLSVKVKGGGIAEKLFFDYTTSCLERWLAVRPQVASLGAKTVFVSNGGRKPGQKMTRSALRYLTNKLTTLSGTAHFSPHAMRRTFATLATENGAPSRVVQVAGGWKSIRMVERYTQALKQEAIKPFSPVDRLMND